MPDYELLIGDLKDASDHSALEAHGVDTILKVSSGDPYRAYPDDIEVYEQVLLDGPQNDYADFEHAVELLVALLYQGGTVLIHCAAGASRSVTVAAAALCLVEEYSFDQSLAIIERNRPGIDPHPALVAQGHQAVEALR